MFFKPKDILIPREPCEEVPIGMIGAIPVCLSRDEDGILLIDTPVGGIEVLDETPEAVSRAIDKLFSFLVLHRPEVLGLGPGEATEKGDRR